MNTEFEGEGTKTSRPTLSYHRSIHLQVLMKIKKEREREKKELIPARI
jgi:hypothetical protein